MQSHATRLPLLWRHFRENQYGPGELLAAMNITVPPVDVRAMAKILGVSLVERPDSEIGRVDPTVDPATITIKSTDSEKRKRFTIAHEIGHLMLHDLDVNYRKHHIGNPVQEAQANRFAADLLMPRGMVSPLIKSYPVWDLADIFLVSEHAMRVRLNVLYDRR